MINGIFLIVLSLLAVPSIILSKKPDAQEQLNKIAPYQGWIGIVFFIWGVWGLVSAILTISWITKFPLLWITTVLNAIVETVLGFLLGYNLIVKYFFKSPAAAEKGEAILKKLTPMQGKMGIAGIAVGIWVIIYYVALV